MSDSQRNEHDGRPIKITLNDLVEHAALLGVQIHMAHLREGTLGLYDPSTDIVWIDINLTRGEQRSVLAHELGHAYYGHGYSDDRAEREADRYAANLLIDAESYAALERWGLDEHAIADELDVTVDIVRAYREHHLQRLGRVTYPRRLRGRFTNALARSLA